MNLDSFGKASSEIISDFEQHIGFSLPEDYKQFLCKYNGGRPKIRFSTFFVDELNEEIPLSILYGLELTNKKLDLYLWNDEYMDDLFPNTIIIGDDPGSGMIVLVNDIETKGVYYWDHSHYFEKSSAKKNIYKVTDSFQAFIDGLKNP